MLVRGDNRARCRRCGEAAPGTTRMNVVTR
jgi:hypothetical protein